MKNQLSLKRKEIWVVGIVLVLVVAGAILARFVGPQTATKQPMAFVESDNKAIQQTTEALNQYSSFSMVVETHGATPGTKWEVDYANMNQSEQEWLASGTLVDAGSGTHVVFDSTYNSTCLRQLKPTEGPWVFHEYLSWRRGNRSSNVLSPPVPLIGLRVEPPYEWSLESDTGDEVVLSAKIASPTGELKTVLLTDPATRLVTIEERHMDGIVIVSEFSRYGNEPVPGGLHKTKSGCQGRNR